MYSNKSERASSKILAALDSKDSRLPRATELPLRELHVYECLIVRLKT